MSKRSVMRGFCAIVAGAALALNAADAEPASSTEPERQPEAARRIVDRFLVSPNGQFVVLGIRDLDGRRPNEIVVQRANGGASNRFEGGGSGHIAISPSGRWVAFSAREAGAITLVDGALPGQRNFAGAGAFRFMEAGDTERLVLTGDNEANGASIRICRPDTGACDEIRSRQEASYSPDGRSIAWVSADGLQVYDIAAGSSRRLDHSPDARYAALTWASSGNALASVRTSVAGESTLLAYTGLRSGVPALAVLQSDQLPPGLGLCTSACVRPADWDGAAHARDAISWREDEQGLFVHLQAPGTPPAPREALPTLALWHWRDPLTAPQRAAGADPAAHLAYFSLGSGRLTRLGRDDILVAPHARGDFVLGFRPYRDAGRIPRRDYSIVNLDTGEHITFARGLLVDSRANPRLSPAGDVVVFQQGGAYFAYDCATRAPRNVTANLPSSFFSPERDRAPGSPQSRHFNNALWQGWSSDGASVLLSDWRDVWALPLRGGTARNLTVSGRRDDVRFIRARLREVASRIEDDIVNLDAPIYFTFEERTGEAGLVRREPANGELTTLARDDAAVDYVQAARSDDVFMTRRTSREATIYAVAGPDWRPARIMFDSARLRSSRQSPGIYLTYQNARGEWRHANLHLPFDAVPGRRYPTIVHIYEEQAFPQVSLEEGSGGFSHYLANGYVVLRPDIVPRVNEPGPAAVDDILAGVEAAVATGHVDRARLAIEGHSHGGYETLFAISQTSTFRAAIAGGSVSNLWSRYGGLYGPAPGVLFNSDAHFGENQPFISGPWWENLDVYLTNSPLYHARSIQTPLLMFQGAQDWATPFENAFELFSTLRSLGDRPVVMLQYSNMAHSIRGAERDDLEHRIIEFLDHFLKNGPAPAWWTNPVSIAAAAPASANARTVP